MPHNEEGEFELVLGNKELLSLLFVVVVLLGVFFAMGFVVGRNSAPVERARASESYARTDAPSAMPERRPQQQQPARTPAQPETAAPAPERPKLIDATPLSANQPQAGQRILQVSAVAKAEAELRTALP